MSQIESIPPLDSWWLYELHSIQFLVSHESYWSQPSTLGWNTTQYYFLTLSCSINIPPAQKPSAHHFHSVIFSFGFQPIQHGWFYLTFWSWDLLRSSKHIWAGILSLKKHASPISSSWSPRFFDLMTCLIRLFGIPGRNPGLRTLRALTAAPAYRSPHWWCSSGSR